MSGRAGATIVMIWNHNSPISHSGHAAPEALPSILINLSYVALHLGRANPGLNAVGTIGAFRGRLIWCGLAFTHAVIYSW